MPVRTRAAVGLPALLTAVGLLGYFAGAQSAGDSYDKLRDQVDQACAGTVAQLDLTGWVAVCRAGHTGR